MRHNECNGQVYRALQTSGQTYQNKTVKASRFAVNVFRHVTFIVTIENGLNLFNV